MYKRNANCKWFPTDLGLCCRMSAVVDCTSTSPFRIDAVDDDNDGVGDDFCFSRNSRDIWSAFFDDGVGFGGTLPKNFQPRSPLSQGTSFCSCFDFLEKRPLSGEAQQNVNAYFMVTDSSNCPWQH